MGDRAELLAAIKAKAVIRGDFILSSGQRADWYVDLRRVLLDGRLAPLAGRVMLDLTWDLGYEIFSWLRDSGFSIDMNKCEMMFFHPQIT